MNKAFTKEPDGDVAEEAPEAPWPLPPGVKNYMTPSGERAIKAELAQHLAALDGATLVAAARREVERRIRALERRLAEGEVVDPALQPKDQVRFGARVTVRDAEEEDRDYWIVGVDQADPAAGRISWQSVIARALIGHRVGDGITVRAPGGDRELEIVRIEYPPAGDEP